jgi:phosphinothricin acetyltransferase
MHRIRLATPGDAAAIAAIYAPVVLGTPTSFELTPPSADDIAARVAHVLPHAPWLVLCDGDDVLGYAYAGRHRERPAYRWSIDTSVYIRGDRHRGGIARALYTSLFALLRLQGFYNAFAGITLSNPASVAFHEAMGFTRIGVYRAAGYKLGAWHDVGWWQLPLRDPIGEPTSPLTTAEAATLPGWADAMAAGVAPP